MDVEEIARFHQAQIDQMLHDPELRRSKAAHLSIQTAVRSLDPGMLGKWSIRRRASKVLAVASAHRSAEPGPTVRWRIASLVESLAILRLIAAKGDTSFKAADYDEWRT